MNLFLQHLLPNRPKSARHCWSHSGAHGAVVHQDYQSYQPNKRLILKTLRHSLLLELYEFRGLERIRSQGSRPTCIFTAHRPHIYHTWTYSVKYSPLPQVSWINTCKKIVDTRSAQGWNAPRTQRGVIKRWQGADRGNRVLPLRVGMNCGWMIGAVNTDLNRETNQKSLLSSGYQSKVKVNHFTPSLQF